MRKAIFHEYSSENVSGISSANSGEAFKKLPKEFKENIPLYVQKNVNLERLENVG